MSETRSKFVLHLELNTETTKIICSVPENFVVALGLIAYTRRTLENGTVNLYDPSKSSTAPGPEVVVLHSEFGLEEGNLTPRVQLYGSGIIAVGMLDWVRESLMERVIRPSCQPRVKIAET